MEATIRRYSSHEVANRLIQILEDKSSDGGENSIQSDADGELEDVKDFTEMTHDEVDDIVDGVEDDNIVDVLLFLEVGIKLSLGESNPVFHTHVQNLVEQMSF